MAAFTKLEDSPMFRKQMHSLEQLSDELKRRCLNLHEGCLRFMGSLDLACEADLSFAGSLQAFGAAQDDPISVAIGGPVMSKFVTAFRELSTYKELLRTQIEHMLTDRLMQFINVDLQHVKDRRKQLDKAALGYDQARQKFVSAKKATKTDAELEEDLENSKSTFEKCRFNLVSAVANIEAKKKYEFLESISAVMDAHMRYFKQGYELLKQLEPFIHQVLTYAQQTKEMASYEHEKLETRIHEFRTQAELANLKPTTNTDNSTSGDGIHVVGVHSYKKIEELMQSSSNGEVQIIKQGYLLKRSSSSRGEWKRKFFVLDSHGMLYYYSNKLNKQSQGSSLQQSRFTFLNQRTPYQGEEATLGYHTIDLHTSTLKLDAEQKDLRFCFRIISPAKSYTLQGENKADQMDWIEKITGVIASLLHSPFPRQLSSKNSHSENNGVEPVLEEQQQGYDDVSKDLRSIPGNEVCAECRAPEPDWASLNLGILMCIECSGVHRNLGVHISKYVERLLIAKEPDSHSVTIWDAIKSNDVKMAYRLLVANNINPNMRYYEPEDDCHDQAESTEERMQFDPLACQRIASSGQQDSCMEGCSPLHFACHFAEPTMIELFVQFGSHIDLQDFHGRTPLHHCVFTKNDALAKYLLKRGAKASIKDGGNLTAFERRMEMGAIRDEELLILFAG